MPQGSPFLQVENLSVEVAENGAFRPILADVSFAIGSAEIVGLFGDSGCGKTTLAQALMGLLPRESYRVRGSVKLEGAELLHLSEREWERIRGRRISFVFQDPLLALNPVLRVRDQVGEVLRAHGGGSVEETLESVRLPVSRAMLNAYPHQLSGGERQRVLLAQALAGRPRLIVADEPFTALDVIRVVELSSLFVDLKERLGVSILVISHSAGVLARVADSAIAMDAGRIVERGVAREVLRRRAPALLGRRHGA